MFKKVSHLSSRKFSHKSGLKTLALYLLTLSMLLSSCIIPVSVAATSVDGGTEITEGSEGTGQAGPVNQDPQPGSQPDPQPGAEPGNQPGSQPDPQPGAEPGTEPGSQPGSQPDPQPGAEPGTEPGTQPGSQPEPQPGTEPGSQPGSQPEPQPGTEPGTQPGSQPDPQPGTEPGTQPGSQPEPQPGTEPGTQPGSQPEPQPGTEPGTQPAPQPVQQPSENQAALPEQVSLTLILYNVNAEPIQTENPIILNTSITFAELLATVVNPLTAQSSDKAVSAWAQSPDGLALTGDMTLAQILSMAGVFTAMPAENGAAPADGDEETQSEVPAENAAPAENGAENAENSGAVQPLAVVLSLYALEGAVKEETPEELGPTFTLRLHYLDESGNPGVEEHEFPRNTDLREFLNKWINTSEHASHVSIADGFFDKLRFTKTMIPSEIIDGKETFNYGIETALLETYPAPENIYSYGPENPESQYLDLFCVYKKMKTVRGGTPEYADPSELNPDLNLPIMASTRAANMPLMANGLSDLRAGDPILGRDHPDANNPVMLFKTAEDLSLLEGPDKRVNTYKITLQIETYSSPIPADVVLVIDTSNSMIDKGKLRQAKNASKSLVDMLLGGDNNKNRVAVVSFDTDAYRNIGLTGADNIQSIKDTIDGLWASGATFTQKGLRTAAKILQNSDEPNRLKCIVLLSDGVPTFSYRPTDSSDSQSVTSYNWAIETGAIPYALDTYGDEVLTDADDNHWVTQANVGSFNYKKIVGNGGTMYQWYGTDANTDYDMYFNNGNHTITEAGFIKDHTSGGNNNDYTASAEIYTVGFDLDSNNPISAAGIYVLEDVASPGKSYTASADGQELNEVFKAIGKRIKDTVKSGTVTDPMGHGFVLPRGISIKEKIPVNSELIASEDHKNIEWKLTEFADLDGVPNVKYARLEYYIEIDDDILDLVPDDGTYNPAANIFGTNGDAKFVYKDNKDQTHEKAFPKPEVNPLLYFVRKQVQDKDGKIRTDLNTEGTARRFNVLVKGVTPPDGQGDPGNQSYQHLVTLDTNKHKGSGLLTDLRLTKQYVYIEENLDEILKDYEVSYQVNRQPREIDTTLGGVPFIINNNNQQDVELLVINKEKPGEITVKKELVESINTRSLRASNRDASGTEKTFKFVIKKGNETIAEFTLPETNEQGVVSWEKTIGNLAYGTYTIEETKDDAYTTEVKSQLYNGPESNYVPQNTITVEVGIGKRDYTITFKNTTKEIFSLSAVKTWVPGAVAPEQNPQVYLQLYRKDSADSTEATKIGDPQLVSVEDNPAAVTWTASASLPGLMKVNQQTNQDYYYFVREVDAEGKDFVPEGYIKTEGEFNSEGVAYVYNVKIPTETVKVHKRLVTGLGEEFSDIIPKLKEGQFTFTLSPYPDQTGGSILEASNSVSSTSVSEGEAVFTEVPLPTKIGAENALIYQLKEKESGLAYIQDSANVYYVKAYLTEKPEDHTLVSHVEYYTDADLQNKVDKAEVVFDNIYKPEVEYAPELSKSLTGKRLDKGEFTFDLWMLKGNYDENNLPTPEELEAGVKNGTIYHEQVTNGTESDTQKIIFTKIKFGLKDVSTQTVSRPFTILIREKNDGKDGFTYDNVDKIFYINVKDNGEEKLQLMVTAFTSNEFKNTYQSTAEWTPEVEKILKGRPMKQGEFKFELLKVTAEKPQGEKIDEAVVGNVINGNQNSGKVTFNKISYNLTYEQSLTEDYIIREVEDKQEHPTVHFDPKEIYVKVTVTDNKNGSATVTSVYSLKDGSPIEKPTFTNTYTAKGSWAPVLKKVLDAGKRQLQQNEFSFELYHYDGEKPVGDPIETVMNQADGTVTFKKLDYNEKDIGKTYKYLVNEKVPEGDQPINGMTYSDKSFTYAVTIYDKEDGTLVTKVLKSDYEPQFTNTYKAAGSWTPKVQKELAGRSLKDGEFTFNLYKGESTAEADLLETQSNGADGWVVFKKIPYTQDDIDQTYTFTVKEIKPDTPEDDMAYDESLLVMKVTPRDDKKGGLTFEVQYTKENKELTADGPHFTNIHTAKYQWSLELSKDLAGRPLFDKEFSFKMTEATDGDVMTVQNDADGKIVFTGPALTFESTKVGNVIEKHYTITELDPGLPGITPDAKKITVDLELLHQKDGTLTVTKEELKDNNQTEGDDKTFHNSYKASAEWTPVVYKVLQGRALQAEEFTFELENLQDGTKVQKKNDADGKVTFDTLHFTEQDIDKTFTYTIKELPVKSDGTPEAGMTYDETVKTYTIKVGVNAQTKELEVSLIEKPQSNEFINSVVPDTPPERIYIPDDPTPGPTAITYIGGSGKIYKIPRTGESMSLIPLAMMLFLGLALMVVRKRLH